MAKSKAVLALAPVEPSGEMRVDMTKDDLVTVGLVEIENELNNRHSAARLRLAACQKAQEALAQHKSQLRQKWQNGVAKEVLASWLPHLRAVLGSSRAKNVNVTVTLNCDASTATECASVVTLRESLGPTERGPADAPRYQAFSATYGTTFVIPDDVRGTVREMEAMGQSIRHEEATILEIKQKLGSMNRFERQLRAELVKARLASTEEGRRLLAVVMQDLTSRIGLSAPQ